MEDDRPGRLLQGVPNDTKRRTLSGASSSDFNSRNKARRIDDVNEGLAPIRTVPTEVLQDIFSRCDRKALLILCRTSKQFYLLAMPILYSTFNPRHWTDVLDVSRNLREGMRPAGVDYKALVTSIMAAMKTINLRLGSEFPPKGDGIDQRSRAWMLQSTLDSLIGMVQQAKNLRSFTTHQFLSEIDSSRLWENLAQCPLKKLAVKDQSGVDGSDAVTNRLAILSPFSRLWSLHDLTTIEIATHINSGKLMLIFNTMIYRCPQLKTFKLSGSGEISNKALSQLRAISIRTLDFEGLTLQSGGEGLFRFLMTLPRLEKLRLDRCDPESVWRDERTMADINLAGLNDVEVSHSDLLKRILQCSKPKVVRNVVCAMPGLEGERPSSHSHCLPLDQIVGNCENIEELHLWLAGEMPFDLRGIVTLLRAVPQSVKRLAIRIQYNRSRKLMDMSHRDPNQNVVKAMDRLVNLERLILPWHCVLCEEDKLDFYHGQDRLFHLEARATDALSRFTNPKLEYVFFQGNGKVVEDRAPTEQLSFNEGDDYQERWIVRVSRVPLSQADELRRPMPPPHRRQWSLRHGTCFPDTSHGRLQHGILTRAEVISTNCLCRQCWRDDKMKRSALCMGM